MDFISAKEFQKQPKEVQKVFLDYWQPKKGEMIYSTGLSSGKYILLEVLGSNAFYAISLSDFARYQVARKVFIPLLTETQLRKFIEDKLNCKINIKATEEGYLIYLNDKILSDLDNLKDDLLQAYWQVAIKTAEEEVKANE